MMDKKTIKNILAEFPLTVELYLLLRNRNQPSGRFKLKNLQAALPDMMAQVKPFADSAAAKTTQPRKIFIFATLHYWIEQATLLGLTLAGKGHKVTLGYLPYAEWDKPISRFDLRRQNFYARQVLQNTSPYLKTVSLLDVHPLLQPLPTDLAPAIEQVTVYDAQYTLQAEKIDPASPLYQLRQERNQSAARSALTWLKSHRPDVVVVPNGTIQEFGVIYRVARYLNIPTVTYEFGDQRERIWLAQNAEIMRHETDALWNARRDLLLTDTQLERLRNLFAARQQATIWENFARLWQGVPAQGADQARTRLGLDERPVVLLATNVLGDSLTLGRQIFSDGMSEWITRTVQYFGDRKDVQLVIRIHPGEALTHGPSMVDVVKNALPAIPEHIHLIGPLEKINTYDVVAVADLGLVYTTTVGMEMAMNGIPVIVAGQTHYRQRGFTHDPSSWEVYFDQLKTLLDQPSLHRLSREKLILAWQYAYRFFFEFPRPFPWHLLSLWEDFKTNPLSSVLGPEGCAQYEETFSYLSGIPLDWSTVG